MASGIIMVFSFKTP